MWLSHEDYRSGFFTVQKDLVQEITIQTNDGSIKDRLAPAWLDTEFLGISHNERGQLSITVVPNDTVPDGQVLALLEWVRQDGNVESVAWVSQGGAVERYRLLHSHGFKKSYRVVMDASRIDWDVNRVYRRQRDSLRFVTGSISGHMSKPLGSEEGSEGPVTKVSMGPATVNGRFIEIVAEERDGISARARAYSILGYLSVVFGPKALGKVMFESPIEIFDDGTFHVTHVNLIDWHYNLQLPPEAFSIGLDAMDQIVDSSSNAVLRAIERYGQGVSANSDELRLSSFFSGIEVLVRDHEKRVRGIPKFVDRERRLRPGFEKFLNQLHDPNLKGSILQRLKDAPIGDSVEFWCSDHNYSSAETKQFRTIAKQRNELYHSGESAELHDLVATAKRMLGQMIAVELGKDPSMVWDRFPVFKIAAPIHFPNYGKDGQGGPDVLQPDRPA